MSKKLCNVLNSKSKGFGYATGLFPYGSSTGTKSYTMTNSKSCKKIMCSIFTYTNNSPTQASFTNCTATLKGRINQAYWYEVYELANITGDISVSFYGVATGGGSLMACEE